MKSMYLILLFLCANGAQAHQPDLSNMMIYEQNGRCFLAIKSSLTAFEGEIDYLFGKNAYKSPEAFQQLAIKHFQNNCLVIINGDTISFVNPKVMLGHETTLFAELLNVSDKITSIYVKNTVFKDMPSNMCEIILSLKGIKQKQYILDNANQHEVTLKLENNNWMVVENKNVLLTTPFVFIWGGLLLIVAIIVFAKRTKKKTIGLAVLCTLGMYDAVGQTNISNTNTGIPIEMLFPEGKTKALLLSYDDGIKQDRQLVGLMNKYGLVGTFHLNANKLGTGDYLAKNEIKDLFKGHEVSVHSFNHPNLTALSTIDIIYEVAEDRKELERLVGYPVRGMAYPFGNTNKLVIHAIEGLGIEYARTVEDSYNFKIPDNFLQWHPTMHQFAKAYWTPNDPENDKKELAIFYKTINDFISTKELAVLDIWGHSWEMGSNESSWIETEKFFKLLANNATIHYTSQIDLVDYINAFRNLKFSVGKNIVFNPGSITVFFKMDGKVYSVASGMTIHLKTE